MRVSEQEGRILACALLFMGACGSSEDMAPPPPEFPPTVDPAWETGSQTVEPDYLTLSLPGSGEIRSVAAAAGEVYVGASTGLYRVDHEQLELVPVYVGEEGGPTVTGAVNHMEVSGDVMVIASDSGIYHIQDWALLRSPANDALADLHINALSVTDEEIWVGADEGLFRVTDDRMESVAVGSGGAVLDVAAISGSLLVTYGAGHVGMAHAYVVDMETLESEWLPDGISPAQITGWGDLLVAAAEDLFARKSNGVWVGWPGMEVTALGSGADGLYLATGSGIYRMTMNDEGEPLLDPVADVTDWTGTVGITVDTWGHVWTATATGVTRWETGDPLVFEDVQGIFSGQCAWCHATGLNAPKRDFESYDVVISMLEPITEWIALDLMPPVGMGGPVSDENKILLQRWIDGGAAP